ncbi:unnamed protein product [Hapterophycus canaliculatus]
MPPLDGRFGHRPRSAQQQRVRTRGGRRRFFWPCLRSPFPTYTVETENRRLMLPYDTLKSGVCLVAFPNVSLYIPLEKGKKGLWVSSIRFFRSPFDLTYYCCSCDDVTFTEVLHITSLGKEEEGSRKREFERVSVCATLTGFLLPKARTLQYRPPFKRRDFAPLHEGGVCCDPGSMFHEDRFRRPTFIGYRSRNRILAAAR